jgi:hypothetical protein
MATTGQVIIQITNRSDLIEKIKGIKTEIDNLSNIIVEITNAKDQKSADNASDTFTNKHNDIQTKITNLNKAIDNYTDPDIVPQTKDIATNELIKLTQQIKELKQIMEQKHYVKVERLRRAEEKSGAKSGAAAAQKQSSQPTGSPAPAAASSAVLPGPGDPASSAAPVAAPGAAPAAAPASTPRAAVAPGESGVASNQPIVSQSNVPIEIVDVTEQPLAQAVSPVASPVAPPAAPVAAAAEATTSNQQPPVAASSAAAGLGSAAQVVTPQGSATATGSPAVGPAPGAAPGAAPAQAAADAKASADIKAAAAIKDINAKINDLDTGISNDKAKYTKQIQESNEVNDLNNIYEDFTKIYEKYTNVANSIKNLINTDGDQNNLPPYEKNTKNTSIDSTLKTIEKYKQEITNKYEEKTKQLREAAEVVTPVPIKPYTPSTAPETPKHNQVKQTSEENIKSLIEAAKTDLNNFDTEIDKLDKVTSKDDYNTLMDSMSDLLYDSISQKINKIKTLSKDNNNLTTEVNNLTKLHEEKKQKFNQVSITKAKSLSPKAQVNVAEPLVRPASGLAPEPEPAPAPAAPEVPEEITGRLKDITIGVNRALGNLNLPIKDNNNNSYNIFPTVTLQVIKQSQQLQGGTRKSVSGSHSRKVSNPKRATTRRKNNNNSKISNNKIKTRNNKSKISSSNRRRISKRHKSVRH